MTSVELYINNRDDLDNRIVVLLPFICFAFVYFMLGLFFLKFKKKNKIFEVLLLGYLISGLLFIAHVYLKSTELHPLIKYSFLFITFIFLVQYVHRKKITEKLIDYLALLFILFIVNQSMSIIFAARINFFDSSKQKSVVETSHNKKSNKLPNIYHIVFDEYQTDMFELTLNEKIKSKLSDFVFYPKTTTAYGRTRMSLSSIFSGRLYDYKTLQTNYQRNSFNSEESILYWLKKANYNTYAYVISDSFYDLGMFDKVIFHDDNVGLYLKSDTYINSFLNLWIYKNLPKSISRKIINPELANQLDLQNVMPETMPIKAAASFKNILDDNYLFNDSNVYVFAHIVLPHFPYVLKSNCSFDNTFKSSPIEQSRCTTNLILEFIDVLKSKASFDDSLIIIQSDHGSRFKVVNKKLVDVTKLGHYSEDYSMARARSLLLIKYPNTKTQSLKISDAEPTLIDLAPTIMEVLKIDSKIDFDGISLLKSDSFLLGRLRYYHFFDKKDSKERTDKFSRYIIKDNQVRFDKKIPVKN